MWKEVNKECICVVRDIQKSFEYAVITIVFILSLLQIEENVEDVYWENRFQDFYIKQAP